MDLSRHAVRRNAWGYMQLVLDKPTISFLPCEQFSRRTYTWGRPALLLLRALSNENNQQLCQRSASFHVVPETSMINILCMCSRGSREVTRFRFQ